VEGQAQMLQVLQAVPPEEVWWQVRTLQAVILCVVSWLNAPVLHEYVV
jgi:hypothetical protein